MTSTETPVSKCPHCGHKFDMASDVSKGEERRPPRKGDISLCINCGEIGVFGEDLTVRAPTPEEKRDALSLGNLIEAQIFIKGRGYLPHHHDRRRGH